MNQKLSLQNNSSDHYRYYISDDEKEIKRNYLIQNCIVPSWESFIRNKLVLELGGGPGYFARYFKDLCTLINTDLSFPFLQEARDTYHLKNVQATALQLPFKNSSFDTIIISGLFVYLPEAQVTPVLKEIKRILKNKGFVLINEPSEYVRWFKTYLRLCFLDRLEPIVTKAYFAIARIRGFTNAEQKTTDLSLHLRTKEALTTLLQQEGFTIITARSFFINLAPPSLEKYFFSVTYYLAPFFTRLRNNIRNGLLITARYIK